MRHALCNAALPYRPAGAINVETDTPVKVSSPIEIDTSERRVVASKGKKGFGWRSDPDKHGLASDAALGAIALSGFGNYLANSANAAGSIVTAGGLLLPVASYTRL
jgi:hypothetical protein